MENGNWWEMEIRAASILAVERIKEKVQKFIKGKKSVGTWTVENRPKSLSPSSINSVLIDHFLWDYRRDNVKACDVYPYHKVRCIYY